MDTEDELASNSKRKLTLGQEAVSVLAAFIGVQSKENRERDFSSGNANRFIVLGLIGTILFVLAVSFIVKLILSQAGI